MKAVLMKISRFLLIPVGKFNRFTTVLLRNFK